jgi:hypothetical protein
MSEESKNTGASTSTNAEAEKDVQNVLAELKAEEGQKADEKPSEEGPNATDGASTDDAAEEARIVAEAAKLGAESEKKENKGDSTEKPDTERRGDRARPRANHRENIKTDFASQKESDDPEAIRKQVCTGWRHFKVGWLITCIRLNFTFRTRTFQWTNFCSPRWEAARIMRSTCLCFTPSNVCVTFSL